ncbi:lysophospholipid acyltransferase family protein [Ramlibacter sp.]|uniref:lysophospholipid acyltransferase family protein n=1 Tax=Ramlibacter sp. TaxID=1917967 RepID=UPI003D0FD555
MKTFFHLLASLPLPLLHRLGAAVGWLAFLMSPTYRRRFRANAREAGYDFSRVRAAVAEAGKMVAETPRLWFGAPVPCEWSGADLVRRAQAQGRGVIMLTPHLGCFEVSAQSFAQVFGPITVLYRPARKAWLRDLVDTARARPNLATAPTTLAGVRQMLKALRSGGAIGLLPDQVPPAGLGAWAPFFGRAAYTMTLPARLARQSGAPVLLVWSERLPGGAGYRVHVREWEGEIPESPEAGAERINVHMERLVRECPAQYLWGYARYKQPREPAKGGLA